MRGATVIEKIVSGLELILLVIIIERLIFALEAGVRLLRFMGVECSPLTAWPISWNASHSPVGLNANFGFIVPRFIVI